MAIQRPNPRYSDEERRLIALLARLVVEGTSAGSGGNVPEGVIVLSDRECDELVDLLEQLLASEEFSEEAYFIENLHRSLDPELRHLFEAARARRGQGSTMGWLRYQEFQDRFWLETPKNYATQPMDFDYFLELEDRLLREIAIHPRVRLLVLQLLKRHRPEIEGIRAGKQSLLPDSIRNGFRNIVGALKHSTGVPPIRPERVAGAMTLVANLGCLFTTRDWSVAGTMSAIGGAAILTAM